MASTVTSGGATGRAALSLRPLRRQQTARRSVRPRPAHRRVAVVAASAEGKAKIAVLGASGYTGAEVMRLMALHPHVDVVALTGESNAGKDFSEVFPHLGTSSEVKKLVKIADVDWSDVDAAFCCLPHATTQEVIAGLPTSVKVVDLSADFRLRDVEEYAKWYGGEHKAPELQAEAVYGLTELYRDQVKTARLVANPGCYPTCAQLPLIPLLQQGLLSTEDIIIDAKSGVSGAGRAGKVPNLYTEVAEGIHAYGVASHRHMPEIEQGLSEAAGTEVKISFTPHLMCMSRGMMCTIYAKTANGADAAQMRSALTEFYKDEPFVQVMASGTPQTRHVRGSNFNIIGIADDARPGSVIIVSVIDNLVKGASGQAIQNMNLILGLPETTGLMQLPMFP